MLPFNFNDYNFQLKPNKPEFWLLIVGLVVGLVVSIVSIVIVATNDKPTEPIVDPTPGVLDRDTETPAPSEDFVIQTESPTPNIVTTPIGVYTCQVESIIDLSTKVEYKVKVGVGETQSDTIITATRKTEFFDTNTKRVVSSNSVLAGKQIEVYGIGSYAKGDFELLAVVVGEEKGYNYAQLDTMYADSDSFVVSLKHNDSKLVLTPETTCVNAYDGGSFTNMNLIEQGCVAFYTYSDMTDKNGSVVYTVSEIYFVNPVIEGDTEGLLNPETTP